MAGRVIAALALILVGAALDAPVVILLGIAMLLLDVVHAVWARRGLRMVRYRRVLAARRVPFGEPLEVEVEAWNRGRLPLAWLRADDTVSPGVDLRERELLEGDEPGTSLLRNAWTLRPWERVRRRFHLVGERRGLVTLGPVELAVGDPFGRQAATDRRETIDTLLVWPRVVPAAGVDHPDRWGDLARAHAGLHEDPARFAGVRPYAPGDPLRRIHPRASARLGRPVVKRYEPARDREVLVLLDVQVHDGPAWEAGWGSDDVEHLYVIAASLVRALGRQRVAFGMLAAGYAGAETRIASVPVSSAPGQAERVLDLLARLSSHASMPFERLLLTASRQVQPGTTVLVLTARDPGPFLPAMRRLEVAGASVVLLASGRAAERDAATAHRAGFTARRATLDGPWRTAEQLVVAP